MNRSFNNKAQSFNHKAQTLRQSDLEALEVKSKVSRKLCLLFTPVRNSGETLICVFDLSLGAAVFTLARSGFTAAL